MNKDIFTYLKVYKNVNDDSIYISIMFSLDDDSELEYINQYDFVNVRSTYNSDYDYIIQLSVEKARIVDKLIQEIGRMSVDREYNPTSTDRIGYFTMLVNCLSIFTY